MVITDHSQPTRANRYYEGWSDRLSREAAAGKGGLRTKKRGHSTFQREAMH